MTTEDKKKLNNISWYHIWAYLINLSFETGEFSNCLKKAVVTNSYVQEGECDQS